MLAKKKKEKTPTHSLPPSLAPASFTDSAKLKKMPGRCPHYADALAFAWQHPPKDPHLPDGPQSAKRGIK